MPPERREKGLFAATHRFFLLWFLWFLWFIWFIWFIWFRLRLPLGGVKQRLWAQVGQK